MAFIEINGKQIELNEEGFLKDSQSWSREIARKLADAAEGIQDLTEQHWAVVDFIRDHYLQHGQAPMVRSICKATGLQLRNIYELFPTGPAKGACKIAGLPKPDGCV